MTDSRDRLDRIETILAAVAESQARTQQIAEQNAAGLRETRREHVFLFQRILKAHKLVSMAVRVLGI